MNEIDLEELKGQNCCVELETRPWRDRTWTGIKRVWPAEPEGEAEYEVEREYERSLRSNDLSENTASRPRKVAPAPKPVPKPAPTNPPSEEESETPSVQPARKSGAPIGGVGGSGKPRSYTIGVSGRPKIVDELSEEDDED